MDWLGIAGLVTSVIGIPLAFVVGRRNRQRPDLRLVTDFDQIVAPGDFVGVKLAWEGQPLERVSRTSLGFWNHRGDHVQGAAILKNDPLRIELGADDVVLQARVVSFSRPQNDLRVDGDRVLFEFLDAGDGGVIEVLHRGDTAARLVGTIPGARLHDSRDGDLSVSGRANVRTARIRRMFRFGDDRRLRFLSLMVVSLSLATVFLGVVAFSYLLRTPSLVSVSEYDLTTIDGQANFASEVGREGMVGLDP